MDHFQNKDPIQEEDPTASLSTPSLIPPTQHPSPLLSKKINPLKINYEQVTTKMYLYYSIRKLIVLKYCQHRLLAHL